MFTILVFLCLFVFELEVCTGQTDDQARHKMRSIRTAT